MEDNRNPDRNRYQKRTIGNLSIKELFREIRQQVKLLIKKEISLAQTELKADLKSELFMAIGFVIAGVSAFIALILLLVSSVFALSTVIPGWLAGLIVSGVFFIISMLSFFISRKKRVKSPLVRTKEVLQSDIRLAKEGFA